MSLGMGHIQSRVRSILSFGTDSMIQSRLLLIFEYDAGPLSTFDLTAMVYDVQPDGDGGYSLTDAQLSSVRHALGSLAKSGALCGRRGWDGRGHRWATATKWAEVDHRLVLDIRC